MQKEDYIFTSTGFRKLSPSPKGLLHRRVRSANSVLLRKKEKSEETVIKSHSMEKYVDERRGKSTKTIFDVGATNSIKKRPSTAQQSLRQKIHPAPPGYVYTMNNLECAPPQLYLNDKVRIYAKEHRRAQSALENTRDIPKASSFNSAGNRRRVQSADVAYRFGKRIHLPQNYAENEHLTHEGLTMGQKQYIWGIARCYSTQNLKELNDRRMKIIVDQELDKRLKTHSISDKVKKNLIKEYHDTIQYIDYKSKNIHPKRPTTAKKQTRRSPSYEEESDSVQGDENSFDCVIIVRTPPTSPLARRKILSERSSSTLMSPSVES
ncbi:uncharacterized protein [Clytia hemisphaerica]|uniref:Uncharacterized protein n=1 Tax=Clytia hemisphaerica TaxID=252671 RepID=A0A7M5TVR5_9CNID|eukprot:TCONS_00000076-protein